LTSLGRQILPDNVTLQIIVVDNDCDESAGRIVFRHCDTTHMTFQYFVQPIRNISLARNMAVANAGGDSLLFIDDDGIADRGWAGALLLASAEYDADAVFGPVVPGFIPQTETGTEAPVTWMGNCLAKAAILKSVPGPFDPECGGEDTELFDRLRRKGARLIYSNEAHVFELCQTDITH
jgi:succinoglycan biosynthesis protein ExoM